MVKTNKKTLPVSLLIVLFSAILLIAGLSFNTAKPITLPKTMYKENTPDEISKIEIGSEVLTLVYAPNTSANNTTPAAGFSATELLLTSVLGFVVMIAVAVMFAKQKKRYTKI